MAIKRTALPFEGNFVQVPNLWVRDSRLSRRARGLLTELMSHRIGWSINFKSLQAVGPEGREALQAAIRELKEFGYLTIEQTKDGESRKFGEVHYIITDPESAEKPVYGFP